MTDLDDRGLGTPSPDGQPERVRSGIVYVFEPNTKVRPPISEYVRDIWDRRRFLVAMADAELKGAHSTTFLGSIWVVVDPLFQAAIYYLLITILRGGNTSGDSSARIAIMVGCIFMFTLLTGTINEGAQSILRQKQLMLNSTFPRALLPLAVVYKQLRGFLPSIPIYLLFHLMLGMPITVAICLVPLLFVLQTVMATGFALLFATLTVFVHDTTNLLSYATRILFFATPVLYPVDQIPAGVRPFLAVGPFYGLFASYQSIIVGEVPSPTYILQTMAWTTFAIVVGYRLFVSNERSFSLHL